MRPVTIIAVATLAVALPAVTAADARLVVRYYAPVTLCGQVKYASQYGPPNFGEQPKTDTLLVAAILRTDRSFDVLSVPNDGAMAESRRGVREVEIKLSRRKQLPPAGAIVRVRGRLTFGQTAYELTEVVMEADRIERLERPGGVAGNCP